MSTKNEWVVIHIYTAHFPVLGWHSGSLAPCDKNKNVPAPLFIAAHDQSQGQLACSCGSNLKFDFSSTYNFMAIFFICFIFLKRDNVLNCTSMLCFIKYYLDIKIRNYLIHKVDITLHRKIITLKYAVTLLRPLV